MDKEQQHTDKSPSGRKAVGKKPLCTVVCANSIVIEYNDGSTARVDIPSHLGDCSLITCGILCNIVTYRAMDLAEICYDLKRSDCGEPSRHQVASILGLLAELGIVQIEIFTHPKNIKEKLYRLNPAFKGVNLKDGDEKGGDDEA